MNREKTNINYRCKDPVCEKWKCSPGEICQNYKLYVNTVKRNLDNIINSKDLAYFNINWADKIIVKHLSGR